ncbi:MAG TPA: hypothetical protein VFF11_00935, partial [Candidatus Binatia bacterium]|nr:hypothetical protein [Candidatus Binatia bacterium]
MNPQPFIPVPSEISVTEPISPAYERVKQMLFKPFDLAKWVAIGFCAWLADLGERGAGGSFNGTSGNHHGGYGRGQSVEQFRHFVKEAGDYLTDNFFWIIPLAVMLVLVAMAVWALVLWLNSRGKFMFLHCVALDKAEVSVPWSKFASEANSLFWFRIVLGLVAGALMFSMLGLGALGIAGMALRDQLEPAAIMMLVALALGFIVLCVVLAIVHKFLVDFVVPIMFLRGGSCVAAWREFLGLFSARVGQFVLYILFQIVLSIAIGAIVLLVVLFTCCVAGC